MTCCHMVCRFVLGNITGTMIPRKDIFALLSTFLGRMKFTSLCLTRPGPCKEYETPQ